MRNCGWVWYLVCLGKLDCLYCSGYWLWIGCLAIRSKDLWISCGIGGGVGRWAPSALNPFSSATQLTVMGVPEFEKFYLHRKFTEINSSYHLVQCRNMILGLLQLQCLFDQHFSNILEPVLGHHHRKRN